MVKFEDKVVWITGASSGIGEQLAYEFSRQGARLILSARNVDNLNKVNSNLPVHPGSAKVLPLDLELLEELNDKVNQAITFYDGIDYFISNAGVSVRDWVNQTDIRIDQKLMNINYFGPVVITKALLPHFLERNAGHFVVMSSLSGKYGVPKLAAYSASKHALHGFFETLRSETYIKGIDITIIIPGIIKTEITAHSVTGSGEQYGKVDRAFKTGYPADKAARKMIHAIVQKKEETFVGGMEKITLRLNRISPWLLRRFIRNHPIKKARKVKQFFFRKSTNKTSTN